MNEKYEITTGIGFYYSGGKYVSVYGDAVIDMPVDGEILSRAVDSCMHRFPYFAVKIELDQENGRYVLVPNDKEFIVPEKNGFIDLKASDANEYLVSVTYYEKHIFLQIFHGLTDGMGAIVLLQTIVRTYYEILDGREYSCPGYSVREQASYEESCDPYEYAKPLNVPSFRLKRKAGFSFSEGQTNDNSLNLYRFSVPEDSIIEYARDYDGGVSGILSLALARAIDTIECPDKPIHIACPMDMRRNLGCEKNLRNCSKSTRYEYSAALRGRPYYEQLSLFKCQLMLQAQKERQIPRYLEDKDDLQKLYAEKTLSGKFKAFEVGSLKQEPIVSYMGRVDFGDLNDRVEDFAIYTKVSGMAGLICSCVAYKGKINICASSNLLSTGYVRMFANEMKDFCLTCSPITRLDYDSPADGQVIMSWRDEQALKSNISKGQKV